MTMRIRRSTLAVLAATVVFFLSGLLLVHHASHAGSRAAASASPRGAQSPASPQHSDTDAAAKPTALYFAKDPDVVPPFLAHDISGGVVSTAAMKGKVAIIVFWATWCGPCRQEVPELIALQSQYKDALQIVGISEDEAPPEQVAKFVQKTGINYPVIMANEALEKEYGGIPALPTSFLINKDGRVVQKDVGLYPFDYYNLQVRALMGLPVNARIETFKDTGQIFLKNATRASELPGVSFAGLTPAEKRIALHRLNVEGCNCGCALTLAECRINDTQCPVSGGLANKIVRSIAHATPASPKPGATR